MVMRKRVTPLVAVPLMAAALLAPTAALARPAMPVRAHPAAAADSNAIDTTSRAAVAAAWNADWLPAVNRQITLTGGSTGSCSVYVADAATQGTARAAYNFVRGLDGLDALSSLTDTHLSDAEKSALIMAANNTLTHYPAKSFKCYTSGGASAARHSDLAYLWDSDPSWMPTVSQFIRIYMDDPASTNEAVPHRRWILRPEAGTMANAYAIRGVQGGRVATNDLYVFPSNTDRSGAAKPKFYAWPAKGYFPTGLEPGGRWSLSASSSKVHFKNAKVNVTYNGDTVKVKRYKPAEGYADNALVWQFATAPPKVTGSGERDYRVTVSHITGAGNYTYVVRLFAP